MKYIDADKLRADIIRRITDNTFGAKLELIDILCFLDTLEEPKEELMKEVKRYLCEECSGDDEPTVSEIAHHFVEWQKRKMMEGATYNELMELYRAIRDELVKRHRDVPVNIKEEL